MSEKLEIASRFMAAMIQQIPDRYDDFSQFDLSEGQAKSLASSALNLAEALLNEHRDREEAQTNSYHYPGSGE